VPEQAPPAAALDARYGRTPRGTGRRSWWLASLIVAAVAIGVAWYVWAGPGAASPATTSVQATVSSSDVRDEHHMGVTFTVDAPAGKAFACVVEAQSEDFSIVGWKVLEIAPSEHSTRTFTHTLLTTSRGTAGLVDTCWLT
jgi:hypothetical protein